MIDQNQAMKKSVRKCLFFLIIRAVGGKSLGITGFVAMCINIHMVRLLQTKHFKHSGPHFCTRRFSLNKTLFTLNTVLAFYSG